MKENVLAKRYARALFQLAQERGIVDRIHEEVQSFYESVQASAQLRNLMKAQDISRSEKKTAISKLLHNQVSDLFLHFLFLLLKKRREPLFDFIARHFNVLLDRHHKRIRAAATTAVPLDAQSLTRLKGVLDRVYDADVNINSRVDPSILGGIVVEVDGQVFDASLQSQLSRLEEQLKEGSNSQVV